IVENAKPDKAIQQVQATRREYIRDAVKMIEKFPIRSDVERTEQHVSKIERTKTAVEIAHIPEEKRGVDPVSPRLVPAKLDHGGAEVEPAIGVASLMPFFQIRRRTGRELEDSAVRSL